MRISTPPQDEAVKSRANLEKNGNAPKPQNPKSQIQSRTGDLNLEQLGSEVRKHWTIQKPSHLIFFRIFIIFSINMANNLPEIVAASFRSLQLELQAGQLGSKIGDFLEFHLADLTHGFEISRPWVKFFRLQIAL